MVLNTVFVIMFLTVTVIPSSTDKICLIPPYTELELIILISGTIMIAPHSVPATPSVERICKSLFLRIDFVLPSRVQSLGIATDI